MVGFISKFGKKLPLDGNDDDAAYQMVPLGQGREIFVETDASPCTLKVDETDKATMKNFRLEGGGPLPGLPTSAHFIRLPPKSKIQLTVEGGPAEGFTTLTFVEDSTFQITTSRLLSVKSTKPKKFSFIFLADPIHKNVRGQIEPRFLMEHVKKLYVDQANIDLQEFGAVLDVTALKNLGNPILTSDDKVLDAIEAATGQPTFDAVDFIVYLVWNVERKRGTSGLRGIALDRFSVNKRYAFIEVGIGSFADQVHALAHEIGHILGLSHTKSDGLMFATTAGKSNRLFSGDIETINPPSGSILPP